MKAIVYTRTGGREVLELVERPVPAPGPGEALVRVARSGVNPTDWKSRQGDGSPPRFGWQIPNHDGAGVVEAVGNGVDDVLVGERVWVWEGAHQRPWGTAAEYTTVPVRQIVLLGPTASYDLGASLGVPFLTAHRCLTVGETVSDRIGPGSLTDRTVLVQGGAGAVGNAAIQLARWAEATVIATVSSPLKAQLAAAAGASHVIDYREQDVVTEVRKIVPHGVDVVVEVAPAANADTDAQVLGSGGAVAIYASDAPRMSVPIRPMMVLNARWQFMLLHSEPAAAQATAVEDVAAAVVDGAVRVGAEAGLPLLHFPLEQAADAHAAVEGSAIGKVLITVGDDFG